MIGVFYVYEASLLEEPVARRSSQRSYPEYSLKSVAPRSDMRDFAEELHAVSFLLQRVALIRQSCDRNVRRLKLERLFPFRSKRKRSLRRDGASCSKRGYFAEVFEKLFFIYYLKAAETASVGYLEKSEFPRRPVRSHPSVYRNDTSA